MYCNNYKYLFYFISDMKTVSYTIIATILLCYKVSYTSTQITFLDSPKFRPLFRQFRDFLLDSPLIRSRNGNNTKSRAFNAQRNKLQRQFQPDENFFCDIQGPGRRSATVPDSVHKLTPGDIDIIGGLGDSLSAANGAMAVNYVQLLTENKGISFTAGGQETWREILTVPNIIKAYNPNLYGYALGDSYSHHKTTK